MMTGVMRVSDSMLALGRARRRAAAGPTERSEVCGRTSARYSASRPTSVGSGSPSSRDALPRRTIRSRRASRCRPAQPRHLDRDAAPAAQPASESRSHEPGPDRRDHSCPAATARGRPAAPRGARLAPSRARRNRRGQQVRRQPAHEQELQQRPQFGPWPWPRRR